MVETIRDLAKRGEIGNAKADQRRLYWAAQYHYGTWGAALKASGVKAVRLNRSYWTEERMLSVMRSIYREHGSASQSTLEEHTGYGYATLADAIRDKFGSLAEGRKAAGIPATPGWSADRVLARLREKAKNGPVSYMEVEANESGLLKAASRHFGRWTEAVKAAGIKTTWGHGSVRECIRWSPEMVIRILREAGKKGPVAVQPLRKRYSGIYIMAKREFGSWWNAIAAAGVRSAAAARSH